MSINFSCSKRGGNLLKLVCISCFKLLMTNSRYSVPPQCQTCNCIFFLQNFVVAKLSYNLATFLMQCNRLTNVSILICKVFDHLFLRVSEFLNCHFIRVKVTFVISYLEENKIILVGYIL